MSKVLSINAHTGIDTRSVIVDMDHPLANLATPPSIAQLCELFLKDGVALAAAAARQAIAEARIDISRITHVVSTTCTNSANPGFDHFVCEELGIAHPVEKVLLQGVGCSGGLASLRTAANLSLGSSFRKRPARILVMAVEVTSALVRSELDSIHEFQEPRLGVVLFSDCASSLILSNGIGSQGQQPIYELLGWNHRLLPGTEAELRFDVDPLGTVYQILLLCLNNHILTTYRMESCLVTSTSRTGNRSSHSSIQRPNKVSSRSSLIMPICRHLRLGIASRRCKNTFWDCRSSGNYARTYACFVRHIYESRKQLIRHNNKRLGPATT